LPSLGKGGGRILKERLRLSLTLHFYSPDEATQERGKKKEAGLAPLLDAPL